MHAAPRSRITFHFILKTSFLVKDFHREILQLQNCSYLSFCEILVILQYLIKANVTQNNFLKKLLKFNFVNCCRLGVAVSMDTGSGVEITDLMNIDTIYKGAAEFEVKKNLHFLDMLIIGIYLLLTFTVALYVSMDNG